LGKYNYILGAWPTKWPDERVPPQLECSINVDLADELQKIYEIGWFAMAPQMISRQMSSAIRTSLGCATGGRSFVVLHFEWSSSWARATARYNRG
jgi:hypothetical protein